MRVRGKIRLFRQPSNDGEFDAFLYYSVIGGYLFKLSNTHILAYNSGKDPVDTFNINADEAASAIARSVKADRLVYLTDIAGLYRDINDPSSFINRITIAEAEQLIEDGIIGGGMLPKLTNCTQAVRGGVHRVHILDGRIPHSMLLEFFTDKGVGTMFHLTSDTDMN